MMHMHVRDYIVWWLCCPTVNNKWILTPIHLPLDQRCNIFHYKSVLPLHCHCGECLASTYVRKCVSLCGYCLSYIILCNVVFMRMPLIKSWLLLDFPRLMLFVYIQILYWNINWRRKLGIIIIGMLNVRINGIDIVLPKADFSNLQNLVVIPGTITTSVENYNYFVHLF